MEPDSELAVDGAEGWESLQQEALEALLSSPAGGGSVVFTPPVDKLQGEGSAAVLQWGCCQCPILGLSFLGN